jgi:hypothetical protein
MTDKNGTTATGGGGNDTPRKEIYTYQAPWVVYSMAWSRKYVKYSDDIVTWWFAILCI